MDANSIKTVDWTSFSLARAAWLQLWEKRKSAAYLSLFGFFLPLLALRWTLSERVFLLRSEAINITNLIPPPGESAFSLLFLGAQSLIKSGLWGVVLLWPILSLSALALIDLALGRDLHLRSTLRQLYSGAFLAILLLIVFVISRPFYLLHFAIMILASVAPVLIVAENKGAFSALGRAISVRYLRDHSQTAIGVFFNLATPHAVLSIFYDLVILTTDHQLSGLGLIGPASEWAVTATVVLKTALVSLYLTFTLFLGAVIFSKARRKIAFIA